MKKILQALPIIVLLISVGFFIGLTDINKEEKSFQSFNSSVKTGTLISNNQSNISFKNVSLFGVTANRNNANDFAKKSVSLVLDRSALRNILVSREKSITFTIPTGDALPMELELVEQKIFSDDFTSSGITGNSETLFNYTKGISYTGIIKGKEHSIASISIFNEFVMGVISDETGNYVLGSVKENNNYTDNYIFYNDNDLKVLNNFKCGLEEKEDRFTRHNANTNSVKGNQSDYDVVRAPVRIYFEADYRMYQDNGSNPTTLINFIQGMFASVATIYSNESIPMEISQIRYWTQSDPYVGMTETPDILTAFGNNRKDNFSGSLAQLLTTRDVGGGIAWIAVLCIPYQADGSGRYSFCGIEDDYNNFPTYSWTVNVVAHELGHNFGSYHTQSCHWPTVSSVIDSCYPSEGACVNVTRPNNNGTIMSYCHLNGAIRLSLGFGPMPGDTIRAWYNRASCLTGITNSSELPVVYDLKQNFPNPFNPSTTIRFLVPEDAVVSLRVYDVSGKEVANLINISNYMPGFYDVNFNSSVFNLPSGPYFYKMTAAPLNGANAFTQVKKMILIK